MTPNNERNHHLDRSTSSVSTNSDNDGRQHEELRDKKKHLFILSLSGKPIYSRYGNEDKFVDLCGIMQVLVSFVQSNDDVIRSIQTKHTKFVFLVEEPLIIVTIAKTNESHHQLHTQLKYVYYQIISILTCKQIKNIFEERKNYDLRRLLSGSERLIDHLINFMTIEPGCLLNSVKCLPLPNSVRNSITQTIYQTCSKIKNIVFILLIGNNKLISLIRTSKCYLNSIDLNIILNLVSSSESFKTAEGWTPICLPKFDSNGFLHAHVSYLADDCQACLLLLTVDRDIFFILSEAKQKLVEKLRRNNLLECINEALYRQTPIIPQLGLPDVRHFIYKWKTKLQYWCPEFGPPYNDPKEIERVICLYQNVHEKLNNDTMKVVYESLQNEVIFGWSYSNSIELYVIFEPLVTKDNAIKCVNKIISWIKKEEDKLFILDDCTF